MSTISESYSKMKNQDTAGLISSLAPTRCESKHFGFKYRQMSFEEPREKIFILEKRQISF